MSVGCQALLTCPLRQAKYCYRDLVSFDPSRRAICDSFNELTFETMYLMLFNCTISAHLGIASYLRNTCISQYRLKRQVYRPKYPSQEGSLKKSGSNGHAGMNNVCFPGANHTLLLPVH